MTLEQALARRRETPPAYTAGSGYTCDDTTTGAALLVNSAGGGLANRVSRMRLSAAVTGTLRLYDRLWSCSGMGFAAGTYTVTTPGSLPARITDNGVGVQAFVENFVAAGAATGTLTLNYLNAATGAAKTGVIGTVVSAPVAGQVQPIPWAVGDTGGDVGGDLSDVDQRQLRHHAGEARHRHRLPHHRSRRGLRLGEVRPRSSHGRLLPVGSVATVCHDRGLG